MTKRLALMLGALLVGSCGLANQHANEGLGLPNEDLIRRNLFIGQDEFQIGEPLAYQYGNLHVDGPTGGMLYRFVATPEAFEWLVTEWSLDRIAIESSDDLPFDFLPETPEWWTPTRADDDAYYFSVEEFDFRGRRTLTIVYDRDPGVLYVVEHYDDMVGI